MHIYLSHFLNSFTPGYGDRNRFDIIKKSSINNGDVANDSYISTTVHIGTHIDMPYHFYDNGQTIQDYNPSFWIFEKVLLFEVEPKDFVIKNELIDKLHTIESSDIELLLIKTNSSEFRGTERYSNENYGFDSSLPELLRKKFPNLRVFGFDTISVSSFTNRIEGRNSHKAFLDPQKPILLLEDMNLVDVNKLTKFKKVIISPMLIENCDGLPCTVFGEINV